MTIPAELTQDALYRPCPLEHLTFETTAELSDGRGPFGQARAIEALRFGLEIKQPGHNLFVMGPPGSGRRSFVADVLERVAQTEQAAADWCYVNDFDNPEKPRALRLPAGDNATGRGQYGDSEFSVNLI